MLRMQADFLVQFTIHRLLRGLAVLNPTLRKLPGVLPDPLTPEDIILCVAKDDADIGAKPVAIDHESAR